MNTTKDERPEAVAGQVDRWVRPRTKDELMAANWRNLKLAPYDNCGTVRTGKQWFDRYMLFAWERPSDFELVA